MISLQKGKTLEKEMATHSGFLPGKSHGQKSLVGYCSWDRKRVRHDLATKLQQQNHKQLGLSASQKINIFLNGKEKLLLNCNSQESTHIKESTQQNFMYVYTKYSLPWIRCRLSPILKNSFLCSSQSIWPPLVITTILTFTHRLVLPGFGLHINWIIW